VGGVQHPVVVVLVEAEIDADAVAQAEQELELVVVGSRDAMLDARRRPLERAPQGALLHQQFGDHVARARRGRLALGGQQASNCSASWSRPSANSALAR